MPKPALEIPSFLNPAEELHPFIQARKQAVSKKFSLKSANALYDIADLAYYLAALGRKQDAAEIAGHIAEKVQFAGNYNLWSPAGKAICLKARLLRDAGRSSDADAALGPILTHPFAKTPTVSEIEKNLASLPSELEKLLSGTAKASACSGAARKLFSVCWYAEMAAARADGFTELSPESVESVWVRGLEKLAARLES